MITYSLYCFRLRIHWQNYILAKSKYVFKRCYIILGSPLRKFRLTDFKKSCNDFCTFNFSIHRFFSRYCSSMYFRRVLFVLESHLFRSLSQHNRIILKIYFIFLKQILCLPVSFIKMFLSRRCTIDESTHNCSTRYAQGKLCIILLHLVTPSNFGGHMSYCHFSDAQFYHRRNIIIKQSTDKVLQLGVFLAENLPMNLFFDVAGAGYPGG